MGQEPSAAGAPRERSRPYRMRRRADQVDDTRLRIIEAVVELHSTVGPAATTVAGIAEQAGVTRATVYRHFPDDSALFDACSAHWLAQQLPPEPAAWAAIADPTERTGAGLADLYRFYRHGEAMLTRVYRDFDLLPDHHQAALIDRQARARDLLLAAYPQAAGGRLRAVLGHAVSFWTWRSLCVEQGLAEHDAVALMVALAAAAAEDGRRP
jgi:AcrR family transcriptional regulator